MFCPKCGSVNDDLNKWCTMCAYSFEEKQKTAEDAVEETYVKSVPDYIDETAEDENCRCEQEKTEIRHYMGWSVIAAVLGSVVFGVVAVIFSGITKTELAVGNTDKARIYSEHTRLFCLVSLSVAIVKVIFIALALAIFFSMSEMPLFLF